MSVLVCIWVCMKCVHVMYVCLKRFFFSFSPATWWCEILRVCVCFCFFFLNSINQLWVIILLLLNVCGGRWRWSVFICGYAQHMFSVLFVFGSLSFGHHFVCTRGLCDQFYRMNNTISDHLGNYARCVRFCCNCSKTHHPSRVLHDRVNVVDLDRDSCELNVPTCCSCSSMDRPVTGCSHGQCAQFLYTYNQTIQLV